MSAYPVVETFHSLQGEGYWTGSSAFFVRLGGCDVGCPWCDTKHSWPQNLHPVQTAAELATQAQAARPAFVVITGGEPTLHDLRPLLAALRSAGLRSHLETSGAHPLQGDPDWVSLSPKPFREPLPAIYGQASELKVVIAKPEDLTWAEDQSRRVPAPIPRFLQPEWSRQDLWGEVFEYVQAHPPWRLSLQTHKWLGLR
ncbi:MAG: 7-carboxy-7-deazaguanine synthase QueE [Oscillatoriales cyanobacterium SM2_1_8]|nr:7-carboxy-7-deazaguanine synthase QueE [Oscillatoriales cyanobacterium SM2_1_8]